MFNANAGSSLVIDTRYSFVFNSQFTKFKYITHAFMFLFIQGISDKWVRKFNTCCEYHHKLLNCRHMAFRTRKKIYLHFKWRS